MKNGGGTVVDIGVADVPHHDEWCRCFLVGHGAESRHSAGLLAENESARWGSSGSNPG